MFLKIKDHLIQEGLKTNSVDFGSNVNSYSLWYNFLLINLIALIMKTLKDSINTPVDCEGYHDTLVDLESLQVTIVSFLDPYLRFQVQKRGITVIQNTYTGFDTEYELTDPVKCLNKLVSVQRAVQGRMLIKVPLYRTYDISYIHPLTSDITNLYKPVYTSWCNNRSNSHSDLVSLNSDSVNLPSGRSKNVNINVNVNGTVPGSETVIEMCLLNESLKKCIVSIRLTKHRSLDLINNSFIEELYGLEGVTFFEDPKKDQIVFALPLTNKKTKICYPKKYSMQRLVKQSMKDSRNMHVKSFKSIVDRLSRSRFLYDWGKLIDWFGYSKSKPRARKTINFNTGDRISISVVNNNYICSHYNAADLSILSDFCEFKNELNIVNKSFVTLAKPIVFADVNVYIRDTFLLAPQKVRSLEALGKLYESELGFKKKEIPKKYLSMMSTFLKTDKASFEEYALRDAEIVLKHATEMEGFNFSLKQLGVPITLSSLGKKFVLCKWEEEFKKYFPYQISGECLMGNSDEVQTPKGLFATGDVGLHMSYFIGNYKGGRNESFMYGVDNNTEWFDYDLTSAYTTAMSHLSLPSYNRGRLIDVEEVKK